MSMQPADTKIDPATGKPMLKNKRGVFIPSIPEIAQAYNADPKNKMAQQLLQNALAGPTRGVHGTGQNVLDGITRTLQAVAGQYIQNKVNKQYDTRQNALFDVIKKAGGAAGIPETPKEPLAPPPPLNGGDMGAAPPGPLGGVADPTMPPAIGGMGGTPPQAVPLNGSPPPMVPTGPNSAGGPPPSAAPVMSGQPGLPGGPPAPSAPAGPPSPADQMAPPPEVMNPGRPAAPSVDPATNSKSYQVAMALLNSGDPAAYSMAMDYLKTGVAKNDDNISDVNARKYGLSEKSYTADLNDFMGARSDARGAEYQKQNQSRQFKHEDESQAREFKQAWARQASSQGFQASENSKNRAWEWNKLKATGALDADVGKPLKEGAAKRIQDMGSKLDTLGSLAETFKRNYVGSPFAGVGRAKMLAQSALSNVLPGMADQSVEDKLSWWKNWDMMDSQVRHDLYGSALTANERGLWDRATVTPGTPPEVAARAIQTRYDILARAAMRQANGYVAEGYSGKGVRGFLGEETMDRFGKPFDNPELRTKKTPGERGDTSYMTPNAKPAKPKSYMVGNRKVEFRNGKYFYVDGK